MSASPRPTLSAIFSSEYLGRPSFDWTSPPRPIRSSQSRALVGTRRSSCQIQVPSLLEPAHSSSRLSTGLDSFLDCSACIVGYGGKFIEQFIARYGKSHHLVLPNIEYVLWAILIGLIIANTTR